MKKIITAIMFLTLFLSSKTFSMGADEICEDAIKEKTDKTFNQCLNVLNNASGWIQWQIADFYRLGIYPPFQRDKSGEIVKLNYRDDGEYFKWLVKAADNKKPEGTSAQELGEMYRLGDNKYSIVRDYTKAIHYLKIASKNRFYRSTGHLADFYLKGQGVSKDLFKAYIYDNIALAQSGTTQYAQIIRDELNNIEKSLDSGALSKAQKIARECIESKYLRCDVLND